MTATPERMDGKDITEYFDNKIAAEIRLGEAINRKYYVHSIISLLQMKFH